MSTTDWKISFFYLLIGLAMAISHVNYVHLNNHEWLQWSQRKFGIPGKYLFLVIVLILTTFFWLLGLFVLCFMPLIPFYTEWRDEFKKDFKKY